MYTPYILNKGTQAELYIGPPQPTLYSENEAYRPRLEDSRHLINGGKLIRLYGDSEASNSDPKTSTIRDYSILGFDLAGRLIFKSFIPVAIADHVTYAADAAIVGHVDAETLPYGFAEPMAAAMIHDSFRAASHLDVKALGLAPKLGIGGKITGYKYPLEFAGGEKIELDVHPSGKKFRLSDDGREHKIYGHWNPFNGESFDDMLLAHWSARLGFSTLFPSSRKKHDTIRHDVRIKGMWAWANNIDGNAGFQLAERWHKKTRRGVLGTRLEDMVRPNTVAANRARGVEGGIRLYDGSDPDFDKAHFSDYDTIMTAAVDFHLHRIDPSGMRFVESIDDADKYKRFLQDSRKFGFIHYDQGMLTRGIAALIATDDQYGDRRRAVLFNLSHDPEAILKLKNDHIKALLVQHNNDPVFVPVELNKTPVVSEFERAYKAGAGHDITPDEYHRRSMAIANNRAFVQRVMESWYELNNPAPPIHVVTQRQTFEDSFVHYGDPKYYTVKHPGGYKREPKDIYKRRLKIRHVKNEFDRLINLATEAHGILYSDSQEALTDYRDRYKEASAKLAKLQQHWKNQFVLPPFPGGLGKNAGLPTLDEARRHWCRMNEECADARFGLYTDCWVVNERGQRLSWPHVINMNDATRKRMWPKHEDEAGAKPHFRIQYERNPKRYTIMTVVNMFTLDQFYQFQGKDIKPKWWDEYFSKTWEPKREWYEAYVTRSVQGPPNLDPAEHKAPTGRSNLLRMERIRNTAAGEMAPEYERIVKSPLGQQRFAGHEKRERSRVRRYRYTPQSLKDMGYDPETRFPVPNPRFIVDPKNVVRITVPEAVIDAQDSHDVWGNYCLIPNTSRHAALLQKFPNMPVAKRPSLLLVGEATGRFRLAAKAVCTPLPSAGADVADAIERAQSTYATIGKELGPNPFLLTFEQVARVHRRQNPNEGIQSVALPMQEWTGFADARAGGLPKPLGVRTGIIVRDIGQNFASGDIVLRAQQGGDETGDEYRATVAQVRRIELKDLEAKPDKEAWAFGKLAASDLASQWRKVFADLGLHKPSEQKLWEITLAEPVDSRTYACSKPDELPTAMFADEILQPRKAGKKMRRGDNRKLEVAA